MIYRAEYIGSTRDKFDYYTVYLFYRYRGYEYMITKYPFNTNETLAVQHKQEQERIDREIEDSKKPVKEWQYEGSAQEGFDLFWEYVEGE